MTKLTETLKKSGWVETTLGECQVGDEVLLTPDGPFPRAMQVIYLTDWSGEEGTFVRTSDGRTHLVTIPVLRAPRPEYEPGTVALIRWREDRPPVRALKIHGYWLPPGGMSLDDDGVEVVRVLLPADQDTPPIEVTDEMVERVAVALFRASTDEDWETGPDESERDEWRAQARVAIAAMGVQK